jgi:hypothetical protein
MKQKPEYRSKSHPNVLSVSRMNEDEKINVVNGVE